jgi:L-ascorbate metabolism protein UlaG (beta-lactamase superfamily)
VSYQLEWFGCATFRLTLDDTVIFLDAYLDRIPSAAPNGLSSAEVVTADWILVGHSHFDHLYGAHTIALATGATIVGSYETIRVMKEMGVPEEQLMRVAGGELVRLTPEATVRVLPALHSCVWTHREAPEVDEICTGCLHVPYQDQLKELESFVKWVGGLGPEVIDHLTKTGMGARGDGGTLNYLLEDGSGTIFFQDSAGCWSGLLESLNIRPDVAILAAGGRPNYNGEPWQGRMVDFLGMELELLKPKTLVLSHHDDFLPGFSQEVALEPIDVVLKRPQISTTLLRISYGEKYEI